MKYRVFITIIIVELILLFILFLTGAERVKRAEHEIVAERMLVNSLMLTDLSIWTEARYTRHPSQADYFSPFQDYPSSIEHFPAGSILSVEGIYFNRSKKQ